MPRASSHFELYGGYYEDLEEIKENRLGQVSRPHSNSAINDIPDLSEEEFVERGMSSVGLNIPSFDYDKLRQEITGSTGNERVEIKLLVSGNVDLLQQSPSAEDVETITVSLNGQWLKWSVSPDGRSKEEVEQEIETQLETMQNGLDVLRPELEEVNNEIENALREEYRERVDTSEQNQEALNNLDISTPDEDE